MTEICRSQDGRWLIERHLDRYLIYNADHGDGEEVWSCRTINDVYDWLDRNRLSIADFDEVA